MHVLMSKLHVFQLFNKIVAHFITKDVCGENASQSQGNGFTEYGYAKGKVMKYVVDMCSNVHMIAYCRLGPWMIIVREDV